MEPAWKALMTAGVPDGALRPSPRRIDRVALAGVVRALAARSVDLEVDHAEPLLAWLRAWRSHWPASFAATFGADGDRLIRDLLARGVEPGRYLKLRRLAIENLSDLL